jgi:hypothetical protein
MAPMVGSPNAEIRVRESGSRRRDATSFARVSQVDDVVLAFPESVWVEQARPASWG